MPRSEAERQVLDQIKRGQTPVSLEKTLLVLAGLGTKQEIESYEKKIDSLWDRFMHKCGPRLLLDSPKPPLYRHRSIAHGLFEYLWNTKPARFGSHFQLTEVVDAQLHPDLRHPVGTCVGLTSLFSVLGLRVGLNLSLLTSSGHLLSRLRIGEDVIDMDHTDPAGFACRVGSGFVEFPLSMLPANVLNNRGLAHEQNGRFTAAKADYREAIRLNPQYANAHNNLGNMKLRDGDMVGAIADYTEAIRLDPHFCEAYCNRGLARQRFGCYGAARRDYQAALDMNPDYEDARHCLRFLDEREFQPVRLRTPPG